MNSCRLKSACVLAGTAVAAGFIVAQAQQALPSGGRKIEFSDPGSGVIASNLNAIATGKSPFPNLENELKKPNEMFQPGGSLQGIGEPLIQRAPASGVNSKKLKELLEKRQDWQFLDLEDYHSEQSVEEMLGIPEYGRNGELKEEKSPLERYYERLDRANAPVTNRTRNDSSFSMELGFGNKSDRSLQELNRNDKENEPGGMAEVEDPLRQLLRGNPGNPLFPDKTKPTGFSAVFGQPEAWKPETSDATRAQAARMEEFKRLWDTHTLPSLPSSSIPGIPPFDPFKPSGSTTPAFALPRNAEPTPAAPITPIAPLRDSLSPLPTTFGAIAGPLDLPVVPPGTPSLAPAPPPLGPTRAVAPAADFNIPKRRFN